MTSFAEVATEYLSIPGREPVTVTLNRSTPESVDISDAWRKKPSMGEQAFSNVSLNVASAKWCVPQILLNPSGNGREIVKGDEITDARGDVWGVLTADLVCLGSRWECVCARTTRV